MTKQRRSSWTPVIVVNRGSQTEGDEKLRQANDAIAVSLHRVARPYVDGSLEDPTKSDRKIQRRADLRFAAGVALALALPAFISLGIYVATELLILKAM